MRLATVLANDVRLQIRHGLYAVSAVMVVIWGGVLGTFARAVPLSAPLLLPPLVAVNLLITTFYFMAAVVLFEKGEGVLHALTVTPLRSGEYLLSKTFSLSLLAAAETLLVAALLFRGQIRWFEIFVASLVLGIFYACCGFLLVVRFDSISRFLLPSALAVCLLLLPLLTHFDLLPAGAMLLHPVDPAMRMMRGDLLAGSGALLWAAAAFGAAKLTFDRFVVRG